VSCEARRAGGHPPAVNPVCGMPRRESGEAFGVSHFAVSKAIRRARRLTLRLAARQEGLMLNYNFPGVTPLLTRSCLRLSVR